MIRKKGIVSEIKTRIVNAMNIKGLNQTLLASRLDTSQQAVNKLLNKSNDISISKMEKIAEALNIKFNELLPLTINQNNNDGASEIVQNISINEKEVLNQILDNQKLLLELTKQVLEANKNRP